MRWRFLSGNAIKIIAAITMLSDHIGYILFPRIEIFRIIGRLAFPIFAFMISEGARYTKNKWRYLLSMAIWGIVCQIPMIVLFQDYHFNIFVTFTLSIALIYALDLFKRQIFLKERDIFVTLFSVMTALCVLGFVFLLTHSNEFHIDYGFFGVLLPVFASLFSVRGIPSAPVFALCLDTLPFRILCMLIPAIALSYEMGDIQWFSLISLPLLLLYSGKRGKWNMKYFFYIFYPAHMVVLYGISLLI